MGDKITFDASTKDSNTYRLLNKLGVGDTQFASGSVEVEKDETLWLTASLDSQKRDEFLHISESEAEAALKVLYKNGKQLDELNCNPLIKVLLFTNLARKTSPILSEKGSFRNLDLNDPTCGYDEIKATFSPNTNLLSPKITNRMHIKPEDMGPEWSRVSESVYKTIRTVGPGSEEVASTVYLGDGVFITARHNLMETDNPLSARPILEKNDEPIFFTNLQLSKIALDGKPVRSQSIATENFVASATGGRDEDIALIIFPEIAKMPAERVNFQKAKISFSKPKNGDVVIVVGYPAEVNGEKRATTAIVDTNITNGKTIKNTFALRFNSASGGYSGGACFNTKGELIGIVIAGGILNGQSSTWCLSLSPDTKIDPKIKASLAKIKKNQDPRMTAGVRSIFLGVRMTGEMISNRAYSAITILAGLKTMINFFLT